MEISIIAVHSANRTNSSYGWQAPLADMAAWVNHAEIPERRKVLVKEVLRVFYSVPSSFPPSIPSSSPSLFLLFPFSPFPSLSFYLPPCPLSPTKRKPQCQAHQGQERCPGPWTAIFQHEAWIELKGEASSSQRRLTQRF